jgi:lysine-specific demethylase 3
MWFLKDSGGSSSDSDEDKDGNYSTLRELLIRPSHKPNGSGSRSASPANNSTSSSGGLNNNSSSNNASSSANNSMNNTVSNNATSNNGASSNASSVTSTASVVAVKGSKKSRLDTLDEVISSVIEHSVQKEDHHGSSGSVEGKPPIELKHFVRRYNWAQKGREPLPIRIMTLTESKILYPDVPHSWLCDGKLLRLNDPNCEGNYRIFQV